VGNYEANSLQYKTVPTYPDVAGTVPLRPTTAPGIKSQYGPGNGGGLAGVNATIPPGWHYNNQFIPGGEAFDPYVLGDKHQLFITATYYQDPDGIIRDGDGYYNGGTSGPVANGGYPVINDTTTTTAQSRPIMLNRPFRSVADMGYAFRDEPWKSLDFFTPTSADAALLDLFCINESPKPPAPLVPTDPVPPVAEAGRVDLNTRNQTVLTAILSGAIKWDAPVPGTGTPTLLTTGGPTSDAALLAASLVTMTSGTGANQGPLLNRSELVTRWMLPKPTPAGAGNFPSINSFSSKIGATVKAQREAAVRALADVGNTRTWNLLIDVIAQSGRYLVPAAGAATDLNKQFVVEGERRYWLHVAIDRYTGKVIAESLEPVYE
jgi:hypothetical protein